jgi:hypothetical protein
MDHHEKLAWSAQHLHALDLEIKDFVKRHPFTARGQHRHGTRELDIIVEEMPLLPAHWPLMAGDAIQNMRTALDHLIWALIDRAAPKPNTEEALKAGYPISMTYGKYWGVGDQFPKNGARGRQARWIGDDALAVVDRTQPYHLRDLADEHPLAVLAAFSNEDKHRNLVATAVLATSVRFRFSHGAPKPFVITAFDFRTIDERWIYAGANLGTLVFHEGTIGCEDMEVEPVFEGAVAFRAKGTEAAVNVMALEKVLDAIYREVVVPLDEILWR